MNRNLITLAALGGVGYFIYTRLNKKKSVTDEVVEEVKDASSTAQPSTAQTEYKAKVETLQGLLKVGIDGIAGKGTNGALENLYTSPPLTIPAETSFQANYPYLRKNGKGAVSPSNVDFYINALKNKNTPNQLYYKNQANKAKQETQNNAVLKDAQLVSDAYKKGGELISKVAAKYPIVTKDKSRNMWINAGGSESIAAMNRFGSRGSVKIVTITSKNNLIVLIDPFIGSSYYLVVNPLNVFVK